MKNKFYLTTPIYYAISKPHIGHAFATLYADIIARYQKLQNRKVFFTAGADEHGSIVEKKARQANKNPQEFVDEIALLYLKAWRALEIQYDVFIRTTSKQHKKGVLNFIEQLYRTNDIYPGLYEGLYCINCENFLTEKELVNGLCPDHLKPPQKIKEKNYFFRLQKYLPLIKEKILNQELKIIPKSRRNEILNIIENGIPDFSISREKVKWGIPFPYIDGQTIYVWVEALINYLTALGFPNNKRFKEFWPSDLHIIGADINKFHSIFWPALLLSIGTALPKTIFVHGFFTINGQKMSKTLGNIIDPMTLVSKFGADATRYLLVSQFPASEHGDIKESDFSLKYNTDLANGIGNLLERITTMIIDYKNGFLKKTNFDKNIIDSVQKTEKDYFKHMENYELFYSLQDVFLFIKTLDQYIELQKPWVLNKNQDTRIDKVLATLLWGAEKIISWLEPFIPSKTLIVKNYLFKMKKGKLKLSDGKRVRLNLFPRIKEE